jgi:UDP-glucuronate 4-epimerase
VSLRFFTVYGPRQRPDMAFDRLIRAAMSGEPFTVFGDGSQARAFTYVGDAVDAAWRAATADVHPGSIYNVSGAVSSPLREVIELVGHLVGKPVALVHRADQPGDVARTEAVVDRAATDLGWSPETRLAEGLARQVAELRRHRVVASASR